LFVAKHRKSFRIDNPIRRPFYRRRYRAWHSSKINWLYRHWW